MKRSLTLTQCNDALANHSRLSFAELMARPRMEGADTFKIKTTGGTFRAASNSYGNWYGYIGSRRELMFWGDYIDQQFDAFDWVKLMGQATALKGGR